jgi:hypothetical protein
MNAIASPNCLSPDDAASVRATAANPVAFAVLYRRYVDDVYRYLLVRSGADEAARTMRPISRWTHRAAATGSGRLRR